MTSTAADVRTGNGRVPFSGLNQESFTIQCLKFIAILSFKIGILIQIRVSIMGGTELDLMFLGNYLREAKFPGVDTVKQVKQMRVDLAF